MSTSVITTAIHPRRTCPVCGGLGYYIDRGGIRRECPKPRCRRALRERQAQEREKDATVK